MRELDIDWLHLCITEINSKSGRTFYGKTTAYLHLMLGEVWLGNDGNNYLYIGEDAQYAQNLLAQLLEKENIKFEKRGASVYIPSKDQSFLFTPNRSGPLSVVLNSGQKYHRVFKDCYSQCCGFADLTINELLNKILAEGG